MNIYKCKKKGTLVQPLMPIIHCYIPNVLVFAILASLALIQLIAWRWLYEIHPPVPCTTNSQYEI